MQSRLIAISKLPIVCVWLCMCICALWWIGTPSRVYSDLCLASPGIDSRPPATLHRTNEWESLCNLFNNRFILPPLESYFQIVIFCNLSVQLVWMYVNNCISVLHLVNMLVVVWRQPWPTLSTRWWKRCVYMSFGWPGNTCYMLHSTLFMFKAKRTLKWTYRWTYRNKQPVRYFVCKCKQKC